MTSPNSSTPWRIEYIDWESLQTRLVQMGRRAKVIGCYPEFREAIQTIHQGLSAQPTTFGDALFEARHLGLTIYSRLIIPLLVSYAVHEEQRIVWV